MARKQLGAAPSASSDAVRLTDLQAQTNTFVMTIPGTLVVGTGVVRLPVVRNITIVNVEVHVGTAPTGATAIFDVNKNGTTIFTTQGNRPTVAISGTSDTSSVPDVTTASAGDYLTVDVDQIGSTVAGANACLAVEYY